MPLQVGDGLYNCAAVIHDGEVLGVVPKSYLPNYREFYEKRWFAHGRDTGGEITVAGRRAPFGDDLIFEATDLPGMIFHAEICEDLWMPVPPSSYQAVNGATIIGNLSASNEIIGKVFKIGNNLGLPQPALADTLEGLEEDVEEETDVTVRFPLDEEGAERPDTCTI